MQKRILMFVLTALLVMTAVTPAFAQTAVACESTHTVAAGEWLSRIAQTAYGSASEFFPIFSATNSQAVADTSFHFIDNPDEIEIGWKLCIPAKPVVPAGLSEQELKNATYKSDFGTDGVAKLVDGQFSAPAAPGTPLMNTVFLGDEITYGDVDGVPSAALVLVESGGGSGTFSTLHLVRPQDGQVTDVALGSLGDRINLTSLSIQDNKIVVGMTTQGPDEPMCCGTLRVLNTYTLNGDKLEQATTQNVGNVEQTPTETPPPAGTVPAQTLAGTSWKWTTSLFNDGKTTTPPDPNQYLLSFNADGTIGIKADCNQVGGTYTVDGSNLTITLGPSTLVACPEGSMDAEYLRQLGLVGSYLMQDNNLILEFKLDSGSMTFAVNAQSLAGTTWDVISVNNGKEAVVSVINGTTLTLAFGADGLVSGNAGCNTFSGTYESANGGLNIGALASTKKACAEPAGVMEQEAQYLAALQLSATFQIAGNTLTIRDASDATQVVANVAAAPVGLAGTAWDVVSVNNGNQAVTTVIIGTKLTLAFGTDNSVSGNGGCNTFGGPYTSGDGTLKIGPLVSTLMLCTEPAGVSEQEQQYLAALQKAATYEISGDTLTIRDAEGAMQVVANVSTAPTGLSGTSWQVTGVNNGNQIVAAVITGTELSLDFSAEGQVSGNAGCNTFSGPYESGDGTVKIGPLASTRMLCSEPAGVAEQETQFLTALEKAATYEMSNSTLFISDADGAQQVTATLK